MQNLRNELEQLFTSDFFPATKDQMMQIAMQDASDKVLSYIYELENDESFKYNSIDDILPVPAPWKYPYYKQACGGTFHVKVVSETKSILVQYSEDNIDPTIIINNNDRLKNWSSDFDQSTEEEFLAKVKEVQSIINSEI